VELDTDRVPGATTDQKAEAKTSHGSRAKPALLAGRATRTVPARSIVLLMEVSARSSFGSPAQR
jgi:hypothetical protein